MSNFTVQTFSPTELVGDELLIVDRFVIADETGKVVGGAVYKTEDEANKVLSGMGNLLKAMEYVAACYPDMKNQAKRTKGNEIQKFLDWLEAGKPITEPAAAKVDPPVEGAEVAEGEENPEQF